LIVFSIVQNLVEIGNTVLKIPPISIVCEIGLKMPIHVPLGSFGGKIGRIKTFALLSSLEIQHHCDSASPTSVVLCNCTRLALI